MRYKYYPKSQYIKDTETGYIYQCNNPQICELLNQQTHNNQTYKINNKPSH